MKFLIVLSFLFFTSTYGTTFQLKDKQIYPKIWKQSFFIKNVIQGLSYCNNLWFFSQIKKQSIYFTIINNSKMSVYQQMIPYNTHAQDLSIRPISSNKYELITVSAKNTGIVIFSLDIHKTQKINLKEEIFLAKDTSTVALSEDKTYLLIRNKNSLFIYHYQTLLTLKTQTKPIFHFFLDKLQQNKDLWFQGLAMKDGYIYTLSGNNKSLGKKYLIIYNAYGKVIKRFTLKTGKSLAAREGKKWELEGLTFAQNKLYTTVMSGEDGNNIKRLYQILEIIE